MRVMLLIYENEATEPSGPEEMEKWFAVTDEMARAGVLLGGDALQPVSTARTVRVRDGRRQVTDGPFAESREQFGGYYLLDVPDVDAAVEWAAKLPNVGRGSIEVRPVMELDHQPDAGATGTAGDSAPAAPAAPASR